ncbi:TonB-dependent siderophore receptor [Agrobacterium tumefaciens]|uniref:TonB-dependent siderophore receptor n=1 Tax=Agrobacterium tumefaciens TaxID=358 RepID=UPI0022448E0F|nr:TonB-dependent siderophore receptor [Agrobacterium tumefaciens]MCW8060538.1 TonB-dependent siderophore receptor [Agrobacterium tumefaciens]MCW8145981.1 TonB-dependent siderophore receptor [Agrobacterium tumefaciens]
MAKILGMNRNAFVATLMISTAIGFGLSATPPEANAQTQAQASFRIPAGTLNQALTAFGRQAGIQVTYLASIAAGKTSPGFYGSASRETALAKILDGSGLVYSFPNMTTVAISEPSTGIGDVSTDGSTVLQTIVVDGGSDDNSSVVAKGSRAATKINTPLVETARSVSVVTRKEIEQRAAQNIVEAVRYSAGIVTDRAGFDPRFDTIEIRGYDATSSGDYKDGLRQPYLNYGMFRTDPYALERVEIVKGPVSVLYGAGTPAGLINKVSKFANGERIREVETFYGTEDRKQAAFDIGDKFGDDSDFSYRLVGLAREGETNLQIADDRYFIQPSITWTPSDHTSLTVYSLIQNSNVGGAVGAVVDPSGNVLDLRASDPEYDYNKIQQRQIGYEFKHEFNDLVTFRQNLRYSHMDLRSRYLTISGWAGTVAHRTPWSVRDSMDVFQVDNQLEWTFDTGPTSHTLLTGLDYMKVKGSIGYGIGATDPIFDFDIANPTYGVDGPTAPYNYLLLDRNIQQTGIYAIDQIAVDNWRFTLGGRYAWAKQGADGTQAGVPYTENIDKGAFTMQASALYAFDNGISPYVSYATSFDPVTNLPEAGTTLEAAEGEQFEIGVKYQPAGSNILLSAVAYHLVEKNKPVLADPLLGTYRSLGELTNKGIELEARANIADGWDVIAAYTYAHSRITAGNDVGNQPAVKPEHVVSLWGNYTFGEGTTLAGLSAGAGIRYASEAYTSTQNTTKNDATFYVDAALNYNFGAIDKKYDGLTAAFNVRNLANQRDTVCNEGYCSLAQGRNITASLKYRW